MKKNNWEKLIQKYKGKPKELAKIYEKAKIINQPIREEDIATQKELNKLVQKDKKLLEKSEYNILNDIVLGMKTQGLTDKEIGEAFQKELSKKF
jgi:hypothetical protein